MGRRPRNLSFTFAQSYRREIRLHTEFAENEFTLPQGYQLDNLRTRVKIGPPCATRGPFSILEKLFTFHATCFPLDKRPLVWVGFSYSYTNSWYLLRFPSNIDYFLSMNRSQVCVEYPKLGLFSNFPDCANSHLAFHPRVTRNIRDEKSVKSGFAGPKSLSIVCTRIECNVWRLREVEGNAIVRRNLWKVKFSSVGSRPPRGQWKSEKNPGLSLSFIR